MTPSEPTPQQKLNPEQEKMMAETFFTRPAAMICTWAWSVSHCIPAAENCRVIGAMPMPTAKAFEYSGQAQLVDGRYTLTVDVPDGLRCGNVYYGPVVATRDIYSWDAATMQGTLTSSFDAGCDGAPGTLTYPFSLVRL